MDDSTAKEILYTLHRAAKKPTPMVTACVGLGVMSLIETPAGAASDYGLGISPL